MGAYGRSPVSRFFRKSHADIIIKTTALPIFIFHYWSRHVLFYNSRHILTTLLEILARGNSNFQWREKAEQNIKIYSVVARCPGDRLYIVDSKFPDALGIYTPWERQILPGRFNSSDSRHDHNDCDYDKQTSFCYMAMDCADGFEQRRLLQLYLVRKYVWLQAP